MLIGSGLSAPAQAAYTVTLVEQGTSVVASGSGSFDTTDLVSLSHAILSGPPAFISPLFGQIVTGPTSLGFQSIDIYSGASGPGDFGLGATTNASSGNGDLVEINQRSGVGNDILDVPAGYVSGSALSDTSTYDNKTFSSLGVRPGTYEWTWGSGTHADSFTLQIGAAAVPAPPIGRGLPVLLAVGGLLFGAKLLERGKRRRLQFG
jgi:hypothetical protein